MELKDYTTEELKAELKRQTEIAKITMANEEKAKELADDCAGEIAPILETDYKDSAAYSAAIKMAEWKDEQFAKEKQALIDKACEWMSNNMYEGTCEQILSKKTYPFVEDFINEFKQAMKEDDNE